MNISTVLLSLLEVRMDNRLFYWHVVLCCSGPDWWWNASIQREQDLRGQTIQSFQRKNLLLPQRSHLWTKCRSFPRLLTCYSRWVRSFFSYTLIIFSRYKSKTYLIDMCLALEYNLVFYFRNTCAKYCQTSIQVCSLLIKGSSKSKVQLMNPFSVS